ncbi:MAG: hypothetical protein IJO40_05925 [Thermoguttaceae bacterium]|nr:hypothetical protein [Thermoguttaceae bacterium]
MIVVRPNRFDNRKASFVAPDWVYPSGVSFSRRATNPLTGVTTTSTFANNYFNDEFRAVVREFNAAKIASGGAPFYEACLTGVNFYNYSSYETSTSTTYYPADSLRAFCENTFIANSPELWNAATWFCARRSSRSQGWQWTLYVAEPSADYPSDAVAFNFAPDYGTPNVYNNASRSDSGLGAGWSSVYWPRPVVGVENLTTGEKIVCREVDHCGALTSTAQRGTIFLKRGFDYRFVRRRAIPTDAVVERDDPLYAFETLRYFGFDALPPTTQTVAASEFATATFFDLEI